MSAWVDDLYVVCLLGGGALSLLLLLSAGAAPRLLRLPRLRLPSTLARIRLPRLPSVRVGARPRLRLPGRAPRLADGLTLFPPGTGIVFLALWATFFGAVGILSRNVAQLPAPACLVLALALGFVGTAAAALALRRYFLVGSAEGELCGGVLHGMVGHVTVAIPGHGVGAIAYVNKGRRVTMPARSSEGGTLPQQTKVIVVEVDGPAAVVRRMG